MSDTFVCEMCQQEFAKARSDEEAVSESRKLWTELEMADGAATVCDDCFTAFMTFLDQHPEIRLES